MRMRAAALLICTLFPFAAKGAGSSVLISRDGYLITNEHVIAGCASLNAVSIGPVIAVGHDEGNDLALLKSNAKITGEPLPLSTAAARLGEEVIAVGYPLQGILGGLNITNGIVSGLGNNSPQLQFTAPVQPGNSGGALLDRSGALVGIVSSKFTARFGFVSGGFAVRREVVQTFLSAQSVRPVLADGKPERSIEDIAELARKSVFAIECL
jgi:serine protease Do